MDNLILDHQRRVVQVGSKLNHLPPSGDVPEGAIVTLSGEPITTLDGLYIITINGLVPMNALVDLQGNYIKTTNNEFITI